MFNSIKIGYLLLFFDELSEETRSYNANGEFRN